MAHVSAGDPEALAVNERWRQWEQQMRDRDARLRRRSRQVSWAAALSVVLIWLLFLAR
ncbi:MAG TPA: hypothetical protein VES67_15970 [Vicinamibacterales bacterium]|nr:hypothetical protein [Vicinamibacterales bacterium]